MIESSNEAGVIAVLVERFNTQRLPRALEIKVKVLDWDEEDTSVSWN